jgi:hypothetical protein
MVIASMSRMLADAERSEWCIALDVLLAVVLFVDP